MSSPLVSIIVPCYNQAQYLSDTLDSVLNQIYQNWECIIVNDGSTDKTREVALTLCAKDERVSYVEKLNGGLSSARNFGINACKGKYVLPLDADDLILPEYLLLAVPILEGNLDVKIVYGNAELFGIKNGHWNLKEYSFNDLLLENLIYCSSIYRRDDFIICGGYCESLTKGLEDWDFWINILKRGGKVYKLSQVVFKYRIKECSMLTSMNNQSIKFSCDIIYKRHIDTYLEVIGNPILQAGKFELLKNEHNVLIDNLNKIKGSRTYRIANKLNKLIYKTLKKL